LNERLCDRKVAAWNCSETGPTIAVFRDRPDFVGGEHAVDVEDHEELVIAFAHATNHIARWAHRDARGWVFQ
jgi:hypothetical protein